MQENQYYKLHGYLEFFPVDIGFVVPVFKRNEQLFVEVGSNNSIDNFIAIPDTYLQCLKVDHENSFYELKMGDRCCYAFKKNADTMYGSSEMLIGKFNELLKSKDISEYVSASIEKFIEKYSYPSLKKVSVMIVDDHKLIRETWEFLLNQIENFEVVAAEGDSLRAVEIAGKLKPQIVLMDINILPISGFEATERIRKISPDSKIIGISMHSQPAYAKKMLRVGARGYVTKNSSKTEMYYAIDEVCKGNIYLCQEIKNILSEQMMEEQETRSLEDLTEREVEIINLIRNGLSIKEIAEGLSISLKTVEVHRHNILKKLKVKNTVSLINYINSAGL